LTGDEFCKRRSGRELRQDRPDRFHDGPGSSADRPRPVHRARRRAEQRQGRPRHHRHRGERDREPAASQARAGRGPGITGYHEGAVILDGELYSPGILNYPALLELAPPPIGGIRADWAAYHADVALRAPFRLRDQGRPGPDGHARRGCPANGLVKNPALGHLAPGRIRVRGGAKFSLLVAFCVAAMSLRFTDTWAAQQHTWAARHGTHPTRPVRRHRRSQPGLTQLAGHPVRHSGRAGPPAQPART
jgi:hypothetical protein